MQYETVLRAVLSAAQHYQINCHPQRVMTDFELAIINACESVFPAVSVSCCFFHLKQSTYRKIQSEGLQTAYNDPDNRELKIQTSMLLGLAFVPLEDLENNFEILREELVDELLPISDYLEQVYIIGVRARGRRRATPPRYCPIKWNQYEATLNGSHRTNNVSEGWHNRFHIVIGRDHPDFYSALTEILKEQSDTETIITEISLGRNVAAGPKRKWLQYQSRLRAIVNEYETYKEEGRIIDYLRAIACNIVF